MSANYPRGFERFLPGNVEEADYLVDILSLVALVVTGAAVAVVEEMAVVFLVDSTVLADKDWI